MKHWTSKIEKNWWRELLNCSDKFWITDQQIIKEQKKKKTFKMVCNFCCYIKKKATLCVCLLILVYSVKWYILLYTIFLFKFKKQFFFLFFFPFGSHLLQLAVCRQWLVVDEWCHWKGWKAMMFLNELHLRLEDCFLFKFFLFILSFIAAFLFLFCLLLKMLLSSICCCIKK